MDEYNIRGIEFIDIDRKKYCKIDQCGVIAIYPFDVVKTTFPVKYVLMDLDGTTVKSEEFWIYLNELTIRKISGNDDFRIKNEDIPFVSGFTTIEHLEYLINKYKVNADINDALDMYHQLAEYELNEIMKGRGNAEAFKPRKGLREFLLLLKSKGIKIGLVTSGLDYKAIPEIQCTFRNLNLGDPLKFYDAIITGGRRKDGNDFGTIGEIAAKPHPYVYSEIALGLGITNKEEAIVLEDSSSGLISARLAGFNVIGLSDGNLIKSGLFKECLFMTNNFEEIINILFDEKRG